MQQPLFSKHSMHQSLELHVSKVACKVILGAHEQTEMSMILSTQLLVLFFEHVLGCLQGL